MRYTSSALPPLFASCQGEWKAPSRVGPKPLLADAVADLLPREFLNRPKMGFTLPFEKWLQGSLRCEVGSVLESPGGGMNAPAVGEVWHRFFREAARRGMVEALGVVCVVEVV